MVLLVVVLLDDVRRLQVAIVADRRGILILIGQEVLVGRGARDVIGRDLEVCRADPEARRGEEVVEVVEEIVQDGMAGGDEEAPAIAVIAVMMIEAGAEVVNEVAEADVKRAEKRSQYSEFRDDGTDLQRWSLGR
jgi:hypothetical protein